MAEQSKPFIIYKSSAGSGKTYTLTLEYLKLALQNPPSAFKQILAVTFTNKATQEMKERILSELNRLKDSVKPEEFMDQELMKALQVDEVGLKGRAKSALIAILHDYGHFSVSTIDSFFQKIVRAFAREIDLNAKFDIELDQDAVLSRVVDRVVMQVMDDEFLHKWLVEYATEQIQNGKSWDIRRNIQGLGKQIFQEDFKKYSAEIKTFLSEKENVNELQKLVGKRRDELIQLGNTIKNQANQIRIAHGLEWKDYNRGFLAKFDKFGDRNLPFGDFTDLQKEKASSPDQWATKTSKNRGAIDSSYYAGLGELLGKVPQLEIQWNTINAIAKNIYVYGVFRNLIDDLVAIKDEENMLLISDANEFLKEITKENDAPFIYEKVGNQYRHFLIDEFQDTSGFQWASFKPLLENSLAQGHKNLLVGDVKQSIYRWRGGKMRLLLEEVEEQIGSHIIENKNLKVNFRSLPNIIHFNNQVFKSLPQYFADYLESEYGGQDSGILSRAYADASQEVSSKKSQNEFKGLVQVEFLQEEKDNEEKYQDLVLAKIPDQVRQLQDLGYEPSDIAFLVRTKAEGELIADCLMETGAANQEDEYSYDVLSDETMYLQKASSVKALIAALKYLYQPEDKVQFRTIWYYCAVLTDQMIDHQLFSLSAIPDHLKSRVLEFQEAETSLLQLPLLEVVEELIRILDIQSLGSEKAYLSGFREAVFDFSATNRSDLSGFLDWWEQNKMKRTVKIPEDHNAMRILTIHKSKGLQFKVVLMPFLKWTIFDTKKGNVIWSPFEDKELGMSAIIPLNLDGKLANSFFSDTYTEEATLSYLDSLNMIYVALTRAEEIFLGMAPFKASFSSMNYLEIHLQQVLSNGMDGLGYFDLEKKVYRLGDWPEPSKKEKEEKAFTDLRWSYKNWSELLELKKYAVDFSEEGLAQRQKRNFGLLVHEILEKSNSLKAAQMELDSFFFDGRITENEREEILSQLEELFANEQFASWFDANHKSLSEQGILLPGGKQKRPDRIVIREHEAVVVDFKTGEESDRYVKQVKEYMILVENLAHKPCKGYLCYLETQKIIEVNA